MSKMKLLDQQNKSCILTFFDDVLPSGVKVVEIVGYRGGRHGQYLAGRLCAQRAVASFGLSDPKIFMGEGGRPLWPVTLTGSITHTETYVAAAVGARSQFRAIGIDAEIIGCVSSDLWNSVFLPEEIEWIKGLPLEKQARAATLIFSGKEAFYKCQYEITEQWLEFTDVRIGSVEWKIGSNSFEVHPALGTDFIKVGKRKLVGKFSFTDELVLTALVLNVDRG